MQKVLFFSHNFFPAIDGGARLIGNLAGLLKREYEIRVLTSDCLSSDDYINSSAPRLKSGLGKEEGAIVYRLRTARFLRKLLRSFETIIPFRRIREFISMFKAGPIFFFLPLNWIKRWKPEVIIAGVFPTTVPFYAWFLTKVFRTKLVLAPCFHLGDENFYKYPLLQILKSADLIIALTEREKFFYIEKFGIESKRIYVFKPPVDELLLLSRNQEARFEDPPTLLFLGFQAAHKRIEFLIDAFLELVKDYPKLELAIAGRETLYSKKIGEKLLKLPVAIRKKIKMIGEFEEVTKGELLDAAWVLVNPSANESMGFVFLEAWARKKPVIAADTSVSEEVIRDGIDGLLFRKDDIRDLAEKIKQIITDRDYARKLGEKGYQKLKIKSEKVKSLV